LDDFPAILHGIALGPPAKVAGPCLNWLFFARLLI
jgi:hypothetical protein